MSDTSCLIELRKVDLLEAVMELPYTFVIPTPLFDDELLSLTSVEKKRLCEAGLEVHDLPGPSVERAMQHFNEQRQLTVHDCFALTLAEDTEESILLTGDSVLRRVAEGNGVEVRGVLWAIDELEGHAIVPHQRLHEALNLLHEDALVFLPKDELLRRIRRLAKLI